MGICRNMQEIVRRLADKYGLDLDAVEAWLRLELAGFEWLVIEKIGPRLVSVAHYYEQNGDLIPDPDIVFFMRGRDWIPMSYTDVYGHQRLLELSSDEKTIERCDFARSLEVADFADQWADNLKAQGWLEQAEKTS